MTKLAHIQQCFDLHRDPDVPERIYLIASSYKQINLLRLHRVIYELTLWG